MKRNLLQRQEKELDPITTLGTSHVLCLVKGLTEEAGLIRIATPGAGQEVTPTLPGVTVGVEAGVDTLEGTLVLEVAPTEVIVVGVALEVGTEVVTDQGLTPPIVTLAIVAVVAGEEGVGGASALTAGHIALLVAVPPGDGVIVEAVDTAKMNCRRHDNIHALICHGDVTYLVRNVVTYHHVLYNSCTFKQYNPLLLLC